MKVGFLGFGEVSRVLSRKLMAEGVEVYTCIKERSLKTQQSALDLGVNLCESLEKVAEISDITISAVVPGDAVEVAKKVGSSVKGVYVDINSVSPVTVKEALSFVENGKTVDASIMGSIKKGADVKIVTSGSFAESFAELSQYGISINIVGPDLGQASALKMLRSVYTKGVSALLFESLYTAYKMGIGDVLLNYLSETECPGFKESAISRIMSSELNAKRRAQEMLEVVKVVSEYTDPVMSRATLEFFQMISKKQDKKLDYEKIFHSSSDD
jgi:3-hydroxyisobutyrate dehydrogenase-like beta-hydroxyacid dehydrogenase